MKKIAILESYENRGNLIKKIFLNADRNLEITLFKAYNNEFPNLSYDAYVITGGIITVDEKDKYPHLIKIEEFITNLSNINKPILGICLGHQLIADTFGGKVEEAKELEVGFTEIKCIKEDKIFEGITNIFYAFNYHWDYVSKIPKDFEIIAVSNICTNHIMKHKNKPIYGIQFHIEYDKDTAIPVLEYLKEEIMDEEMDYEYILKKNNLFNKKIILKLIRNFLNEFCSTTR
ncbi:MAG: type 1 glutamine amidotransferase [Candidatus Woesearchaeota archaeon]